MSYSSPSPSSSLVGSSVFHTSSLLANTHSPYGYDGPPLATRILYGDPSAVTKLLDGIFVGGIEAGQDLEFCLAHKISHVLNCSGAPDVLAQYGLKYLSLRWIEGGHGNTATMFDAQGRTILKIYKFLEMCRSRGDGVLIHSMDGNTRAVGVCIAYLMKKLKWGMTKCIEFIRLKRPAIQPSPTMLKQLARAATYLQLNPNDHNTSFAARWLNWPISSKLEQLLHNTFMNGHAIPINTREEKEKENVNASANKAETGKKKRLVWIDEKDGDGCADDGMMDVDDYPARSSLAYQPRSTFASHHWNVPHTLSHSASSPSTGVALIRPAGAHYGPSTSLNLSSTQPKKGLLKHSSTQIALNAQQQLPLQTQPQQPQPTTSLSFSATAPVSTSVAARPSSAVPPISKPSAPAQPPLTLNNAPQRTSAWSQSDLPAPVIQQHVQPQQPSHSQPIAVPQQSVAPSTSIFSNSLLSLAPSQRPMSAAGGRSNASATSQASSGVSSPPSSSSSSSSSFSSTLPPNPPLISTTSSSSSTTSTYMEDVDSNSNNNLVPRLTRTNSNTPKSQSTQQSQSTTVNLSTYPPSAAAPPRTLRPSSAVAPLHSQSHAPVASSPSFDSSTRSLKSTVASGFSSSPTVPMSINTSNHESNTHTSNTTTSSTVNTAQPSQLRQSFNQYPSSSSNAPNASPPSSSGSALSSPSSSPPSTLSTKYAQQLRANNNRTTLFANNLTASSNGSASNSINGLSSATSNGMEYSASPPPQSYSGVRPSSGYARSAPHSSSFLSSTPSSYNSPLYRTNPNSTSTSSGSSNTVISWWVQNPDKNNPPNNNSTHAPITSNQPSNNANNNHANSNAASSPTSTHSYPSSISSESMLMFARSHALNNSSPGNSSLFPSNPFSGASSKDASKHSNSSLQAAPLSLANGLALSLQAAAKLKAKAKQGPNPSNPVPQFSQTFAPTSSSSFFQSSPPPTSSPYSFLPAHNPVGTSAKPAKSKFTPTNNNNNATQSANNTSNFNNFTNNNASNSIINAYKKNKQIK